jgi:hypothetical protein
VMTSSKQISAHCEYEVWWDEKRLFYAMLN